MNLALLLARAAHAHQGLVMPWDPDDVDYVNAPPDAWMALDLHVSVILGVGLFAWGYVWLVTRGRVRHGWSDAPVETWRMASFLFAQFVLLLALNGPIHHLSDYYLFSAHMVQHLMLNLIWAPLTVLALPSWLIEAGLRVPWLKRISDALSGLRVKFVVYNGMLYFWHIPMMYDGALTYHPVHIVEHLGFMGTSVIAWFGLLCHAPSLPPPRRFAQLFYLFVMTLPMKLLGAIITIADAPIYQGYLAAPRVFGLTPLQDQGWGGLLMWLPGGLALWGSMIYVFAQWWREEKAKQAEEAQAFAREGGA